MRSAVLGNLRLSGPSQNSRDIFNFGYINIIFVQPTCQFVYACT